MHLCKIEKIEENIGTMQSNWIECNQYISSPIKSESKVFQYTSKGLKQWNAFPNRLQFKNKEKRKNKEEFLDIKVVFDYKQNWNYRSVFAQYLYFTT